jgi:Gpi18-like mannosyltransferase
MLGVFMVFYQLVRQDGNEEQATRSVLYLAVFPTAFFLVAAYNESLFLFLAVSSFYCMRRGNWWLAGLCGGLASLTRSAGVLLLVPFCYEYLRQHEFSLRKIRFSVVNSLLIPAGLAIFAIYCYYTLHDLLAFSHAQVFWGRHLSLPWDGFVNSYYVMQKKWGLTFDAFHNAIDFSAGLIMLVLLVLSFVGPWRFRRDQLAYPLYAVAAYLLLILFPGTGEFPLESLSRLVIELFPLFVVLAAMGKRSSFNIHYLTISAGLLAFMLLQFLMGKWIV